ncbi:hypothetical protein NIES2134_106500 [Thermostichus vulcanus NIES-2134]|nr:hypothetical protein NIES2134_106500 [Thermostichus vulcanus NIES-2134]
MSRGNPNPVEPSSSLNEFLEEKLMDELSEMLHWQQAFIATNLLVLGYNAWAGYLCGERGVVICSTNSPGFGIAGESFRTHFVPRSRLAPFLNAWLAAPDTVILRHHFMTAHILEAVDAYHPATELIFLLESCNRVTFFYLKNLPIAPPQCYEQVRRNWQEFQLAIGQGQCQTIQ